MKFESFQKKIEKASQPEKPEEAADAKIVVPEIFVNNPNLLQDPNILQTFTEGMHEQEVQNNLAVHERKTQAIEEVSKWEGVKNIGRYVIEQAFILGGGYWLGSVMQNGFEMDAQTTAFTVAAAGLTASGLAFYRMLKNPID